MPELIEPSDARAIALRHAVEVTTSYFSAGSSADATARVTDSATLLYQWLTQPIPDPALTALTDRITTLEARMTLSETALADLDAATNQVAAELDTLRGELTTADSAVADKIAAAANRLRGLAADPTNPVPAPAPAPEPAPAEPAPAPGA